MAIGKKELQERVALLKRLKQNLKAQRKKFHNYLNLLEKEGQSIEEGKIEILESQVAMETNLVGEITALQRVIEPLDQMVRTTLPKKEMEQQDKELEDLRSSLDNLREQVQEKNTFNRQALEQAMEQVKNKIFKIKPKRGKNPYGGYRQSAPSMIDITT
jgi:flagellar biosynthesis/type III secretory pathway chaperone